MATWRERGPAQIWEGSSQTFYSQEGSRNSAAVERGKEGDVGTRVPDGNETKVRCSRKQCSLTWARWRSRQGSGTNMTTYEGQTVLFILADANSPRFLPRSASLPHSDHTHVNTHSVEASFLELRCLSWVRKWENPSQAGKLCNSEFTPNELRLFPAIRYISDPKRKLVKEVSLFHTLEYIAWELHNSLVEPTDDTCAFLKDMEWRWTW